MDLVANKEMSKISVSDLSAKALVNRSTFYLHYADVSAVAADIEKEIEGIISLYIDDFTATDIYDSTYTLFRKLTNRLEENERMKRYIIYSTNSDYIIAKLKSMFVDKAVSSIQQRIAAVNEKNLLYPLTYAASGIVDSYVKWVRSNDDSITLEELIRETSQITEYIISTVTKI